MIDEKGIACLGDFWITPIVTDPNIAVPGSTTNAKLSVIRYMAPELLNPSQFGQQNSNQTTESDVYSFAVTAFEV